MTSHHEKEAFPPRPDHEHEWEALERVLASVIDGRQADYLSAPMTTGQRFVEWYRAEGHTLEPSSEAYRRAREINVIKPNSLHVRKFVERLRAERRIVIEPTSLHLPHWTQNDYRHLWGRVIERYVQRVWLLNGWQYSNGCAYEFYVASQYGVETLSEDGEFITRQRGVQMIELAISEMETVHYDSPFLREALKHLRGLTYESAALHFKDEALDELANSANVAQFVSFGPGQAPEQHYCHIIGIPVNHWFSSIEEAVGTLLEESPEGLVNVRSFKPDDSESHPFEMRLKTVEEVVAKVRSLAGQGLWTIVNETIDVSDGGVSGVLTGGVVEFSPDATPRCVEEPGTARLPFENAMHILDRVYGFRPALNYEPGLRVEFSLHPLRRGVRHDHTIIWEIRVQPTKWGSPDNSGLSFGPWPNNFSRFLGDKVFGLLVADSLGLSVPYSRVIPRRIAPFEFGRKTGSGEMWLRTSPRVKEAGHYPTCYGWQDPYKLIKEVDKSGAALPAILAQESVESVWSGALNTQKDGPKIEGVRGFGDKFMQGQQPPENLPAAILQSVQKTFEKAFNLLGPISMEWAFDGETTWILQLHMEQAAGYGDIIVEGTPSKWRQVDAYIDLERLRGLAEHAHNNDEGIELVGRVGVTSHKADILRKANVPSRIVEGIPN